LRATNSLTGEKESFVPIEGKKVRWYTCGPTVYDVSHMGHARAYLTFDILRRIMSQHFGYELTFQINITDIDDKIILRSRQNKLFSDFCEGATKMDDATLRKTVDAAMDTAEKKLQGKKPADPAAGASEKDKAEYEKLLQEHELKLGQFVELRKRVEAAKSGPREELLQAAREPLMAKLDKELGHTVTDNAVSYAHARRYEDEYFEDMDALGVLRPDIVTRITDYMDGRVQRFIERLEELSVAYESNGSVYFSIDDFKKRGHDYRKLVPAASTTAAEMEEGEGALAVEDAEKRNPNDFAMWKKSKPGEPAWDSKWGKGRPGWHIECSVMALDRMGEFLDIHGGGEDLKFPHHDNEMAQSEAYLCRPQWTNYFWHAGHLHIEGLKMSKSLKNFITIRQALEMHSARQLRLMFLMQQWDKGMNYSDQAIEKARGEERKFKHVLGCLRFFLRHPHSQGASGVRESKLAALTASTKESVEAALRDNFATARAIEALSKLASECYASYDALPVAVLEPVREAAAYVERMLGIFGVEGLATSPAQAEALTPALDAFAGLRQELRVLAREKASAAKILEASERASPAVAEARERGLKDCVAAFEAFQADIRNLADKPPAELLKRCDEVRDKDFVALGVRLEDRGSDSFVWMFEQSEVLTRELREQAEKAAAASQQKLANKLSEKKVELKKAEKAAVKPEALFKNGEHSGKYSAFDEEGLPTKLASGEELSAKKRKDLQKELAKQSKDFEKLAKQAGDAEKIEALLAKLKSEVDGLEKQLAA